MGVCGDRTIPRRRRAWYVGRALLGLSAGVCVGCGASSSAATTGTVASTPVLTLLKVSLSADTLSVGQSATASITALDQAGSAIAVGAPVWNSTIPAVATVSPAGVVNAVAPGRTTVIAEFNGRQGRTTLTVIQVPVSRVSITPGAARLVRGTTLQLAAVPLDFSGRALTGRTIDWSTSDASIATVTSTGAVTAVSTGTATITSSCEGASASAVVTITSAADSVATMTVSPGAASMIVGGSLQLSAALKDAAGNTVTRAVTWSASGLTGTNVVTVSATGLVTAVSAGAAIIEAFSEGQHGTATVTVSDAVDTNIVVTFAGPTENELTGDTLHVFAGVKSIDPLASVVATVGQLRTTLKLTHVGGLGGAVLWAGVIDMTDLPSGPYQVVVTATDVRGARGVGSRQFQRDTRVGKGGSGEVPKIK